MSTKKRFNIAKVSDNENTPKSRCQHKMVYDGINTGYIFGGRDDHEHLSDLWSFKCVLIYCM